MSTEQEMEAVFEAVLFVTPEPVPRLKLLSLFAEREKEAAEGALDRVLDRYRRAEDEGEEDDGRGVMVDEVAGGVRLVTRPELHGFLRRFFEISGNNKLTMAGLETLAIIAYRQPMTGPEIQELRGKNSSGVLKTLLERRMIRISGRKEVVGKPFLYSTTRDFLLHFGLKNLQDLPPLEEFEEVFLSEGGSFEPDEEELAMQQLALVEDAESDEEDDDEASSEVTLDDDAEADPSLHEAAGAEASELTTEVEADTSEADTSVQEAVDGNGRADYDDVKDAADSSEPEALEDIADLNANGEAASTFDAAEEPDSDSDRAADDEGSGGRVLEMPGNASVAEGLEAETDAEMDAETDAETDQEADSNEEE